MFDLYTGIVKTYQIGKIQYAVVGLDGRVDTFSKPIKHRFDLCFTSRKLAIIYKPLGSKGDSNWYFLDHCTCRLIRVHEQLCTITLGLVDWPTYILIWISEALLEISVITDYQKLRIIEGVKSSIKRISGNKLVIL